MIKKVELTIPITEIDPKEKTNLKTSLEGTCEFFSSRDKPIMKVLFI